MFKITTYFGDNSLCVRCPFYEGSDRELSLQNRETLAERLGISPENLVIGNQRHSSAVKVISQQNYHEAHEADALITDIPGVALGVVTADCLPILIHDAEYKIIVTIHAGWKGLRDGIIENTLSEMKNHFGVATQNLVVQIGPHISEENYQVGEEFLEYFSEFLEAFSRADTGLYFSQSLVATKQLETLGVRSENIIISDICTFGNSQKYFSFRANSLVENGVKRAGGNNISVIMIKK